MRLGITGFGGSGKKTVFEALTKNVSDNIQKVENRIGTIRVPDERVDKLSGMYKPKKTAYAQVEYFLPGQKGGKDDQSAMTGVRDCDALIHVVRNFSIYGADAPTPVADIDNFDQELVINDLVITEKRIERLELDRSRGKQESLDEKALLERCKTMLEEETPLRKDHEMSDAHQLKGFAFLSAKQKLVLFNNEDDDEDFPKGKDLSKRDDCMVIRAKLEQELSCMSDVEAAEFLEEFNISASATHRVVKKSYDLLGLISFFTVGEDEVKAWTIQKDTHALDAAEVIHSDIKKGFIRAEVVAYDDLMDAGSYAEARKNGTVRLEGKTYPVKDGDIIHFRFNV